MSTPTKRERLEARVTSDQKELFQRAADLEGRSLTDFIVTTLQRASEETIQRHEGITLSPRDSADFVRALLTERPPNEKLREAVQIYREFLRENST